MNPEELERFVRAFVIKEKRGRWLSLLASEKGRAKLVGTFYHHYDFDPRFAEPFDPKAGPDEIVRRLKKEGAGTTGMLLSSESDLDGRTMNTRQAVETMYASGSGTYLVFDPERLAYFESEDEGQRFLLKR
jgi:hypothetical protein